MASNFFGRHRRWTRAGRHHQPTPPTRRDSSRKAGPVTYQAQFKSARQRTLRTPTPGMLREYQRNAERDACPHRKDRPRSRTADPDLSISERTIWPLGGDGGSRVKLLLDLRVADECDSNHKQHRANDPQPEEPTSPIHCWIIAATAPIIERLPSIRLLLAQYPYNSFHDWHFEILFIVAIICQLIHIRLEAL